MNLPVSQEKLASSSLFSAGPTSATTHSEMTRLPWARYSECVEWRMTVPFF
jgi:hypothetical protein